MCVYSYLEQGSTLVCDLSSRAPTAIRPRIGLYLKSCLLSFLPSLFHFYHCITSFPSECSLKNSFAYVSWSQACLWRRQSKTCQTLCQVSLPNRLQSQLLVFGPVSLVDTMANLRCTPDQRYMDICDQSSCHKGGNGTRREDLRNCSYFK